MIAAFQTRIFSLKAVKSNEAIFVKVQILGSRLIQ
jgi:hypothetical protein